MPLVLITAWDEMLQKIINGSWIKTSQNLGFFTEWTHLRALASISKCRGVEGKEPRDRLSTAKGRKQNQEAI